MNMAENIVRWWKHKILGGYKQFSVQDNATDCEQLMYQHARASSSCSAPPDLLLLNDRDINLSADSVDQTRPSLTTVLTVSNDSHQSPPLSETFKQNGVMKVHAINQQQTSPSIRYYHQYNQQIKSKPRKSSCTIMNSSNRFNNNCNISNQQKTCMRSSQHKKFHEFVEMESMTEENQSQQQTQHQHENQQANNVDERIRLEEFSCNVSVERDGKSSQPLQFSFTFYDLDGHHGKITKDDIVGIVYTIYEAIGKSVVVPHCGSKTINVRLTLSPDGKSKAKSNLKMKVAKSKFKSKSKSTCHDNRDKDSSTSDENCVKFKSDRLISTGKTRHHINDRRAYRYRPRKLIKSDDEGDADDNDDADHDDEDKDKGDDHNSPLDRKGQISLTKNGPSRYSLTKQQQEQQHHKQQRLNTKSIGYQRQQQQLQYYPSHSKKNNDCKNLSSKQEVQVKTDDQDTCTECTIIAEAVKCAGHLSHEMCNTMSYQQTSEKVGVDNFHLEPPLKPLKRFHKQKGFAETRRRSLSVGNNSNLNDHRQKREMLQQHQQQQQQRQHQSLSHGTNLTHNIRNSPNAIENIQLCSTRNTNEAAESFPTSPPTSSPSPKVNSMESWRTSFNRNELISIIRKSMEKNRLCFQTNRNSSNNKLSENGANILAHNQFLQSSVQYKSNNNCTNINLNNNRNNNEQQQSPTILQLKSRRRSGTTISKIPTLIANHSNSPITQNTQLYGGGGGGGRNFNWYDHNRCDVGGKRCSSLLAPQNIVITDQRKYDHITNNGIIKPSNYNTGIKKVGHNTKLNLCSYDSFLHATICRNDNNMYKLPTMNGTVDEIVTLNSTYEQPIAAVKPIMSPVFHKTPKELFSQIPCTSNNNKSNKLNKFNKLQNHNNDNNNYKNNNNNNNNNNNYNKNGNNSQQLYNQISTNNAVMMAHAENTPQYHGYQRLTSTTKHNLAALNLLSPHHIEKSDYQYLEKCQRRGQLKNYDQLLYAKLSEKLQQTNLIEKAVEYQTDNGITSSSHNTKNYTTYVNDTLEKIEHAADAIADNGNTVSVNAKQNSYITMAADDPLECENLISQTTSDDDGTDIDNESQSQSEMKNDNRLNKYNAAMIADQSNDLKTFEETQTESVTLNDHCNATLRPMNVDIHAAAKENSNFSQQDHRNDDDIDVDTGDIDKVNIFKESTIAATNNNTPTPISNCGKISSLTHRYVHEHIHHHYHHFDDKEP